MKKHNIAFALLLSLTTVACSSGGGDSSQTTNTRITPSKIPLSTTQLNTASTAQPDTASTAQADTTSTAQPDTASTAQPDTASTTQPDTASTAQPDTTSTTQPDTVSTAQPDTASTAQPDTTSTTQPDTASTAQPDTTSTTQPDTTSTAQPDTTSTAQPDTASTTQPDTTSTTQPETSPTTEPTSIGEIEYLRNFYDKNEAFNGVRYEIPKAGGQIDIVISGTTDGSTRPYGAIYIEEKDTVLELFPTGFSSNSISIIEENMPKRVGKQGNDTMWGLISEKDLDTVYMISHGKNPTPLAQMPSTGEFTYSGTAYHNYDPIKEGKPNRITPAKAEFLANFTDKTITGTIKAPNGEFEDVNLAAKIKDRVFDGKVNNTEMVGGFYGSNASEMTGIYERVSDDNNNYHGVFGAKK